MICVMIAWFCATDRDGDIVLVCPSNVCEGIIIIIARIHEQPFSLPPTMDAALALPSRAHLPSDMVPPGTATIPCHSLHCCTQKTPSTPWLDCFSTHLAYSQCHADLVRLLPRQSLSWRPLRQQDDAATFLSLSFCGSLHYKSFSLRGINYPRP